MKYKYRFTYLGAVYLFYLGITYILFQMINKLFGSVTFDSSAIIFYVVGAIFSLLIMLNEMNGVIELRHESITKKSFMGCRQLRFSELQRVKKIKWLGMIVLIDKNNRRFFVGWIVRNHKDLVKHLEVRFKVPKLKKALEQNNKS